jgi:tetratricopeptide (TPR) repeat protein
MKEAELYARDGRTAEAVDRLNRVVAANPDPIILASAQIALGAQLRELGDTAKAAEAFRAALAVNERHRGALAMLLEIETDRKEFEAAAQTAARLVAVCPDGADRADALMRLARLEHRRGAAPAAIQAYAQAVATTGMDGAAGTELKALFAEARKRGERPSWQPYVDALKSFIERLRADDPRLSATYLELSRALADELGDVNTAISTLQNGAARFPKDGALRKELAARYRANGRVAEASEELRRLVDLEPLSLQVWQGLGETLTTLGRTELATSAVDILVALGGGSDFDRVNAETRGGRLPALEANALDHETRALLDAGTPEDVATSRLLSSAALGLERVYPPDFDAYGLSRGDRISPRSGHPVRLMVDRIARILGMSELDVYVHRAHSGSIEVEFSDPVSLMIPAHITAFTESQQAFLIARVLVNLARGLHPVDKLAPSALAEVLIAAMRIVDPTFGAGQGNAEYLDTLTKNLYKGLPRRGRRPLEEAAAAYGPSPKPRLDDWLLRVRKTATRAAMLVSGDPAGVIGILRRTEGDLSGAEGANRERAQAVLSDVLRFAVSDVATTVRRRIGA